MKVFLNRVLNIIRPYFLLEITGFLLTVLYTLAIFASPIVSQYLVDEVIITKSMNKLYYGIALFTIVCVFQPIFGYFKDIIFLRISESITLDIRIKLFERILSAPLTFFDKVKKGELISRIISDGRAASDFITNFFVIIIKNLLLIVLIIIGMFSISATITGIILVIFCAFIIINWKISKRFTNLSQQAQQNSDAICTNINQMAESVVTIKSFLAEKQTLEKYYDIVHKTNKDNRSMGYLNALVNNISNILVVLSLGIIYGLGSLGVMNDQLTLGQVVALGLYFQLLVQPLYELIGSQSGIRKAVPIFDRLYEYFELKSEPCGSVVFPVPYENISVNQLSFTYADGTKALTKVNMTLPKNGLVAFVGPSGSGKSTFVKMLLGFYRPEKGGICINSTPLMDIGVEQLRAKISFVSQDLSFLNMSIEDNLRSGNRYATYDEMVSVCSQVGLHEKIESLPGGYGSIINERVNFSGGEIQRLAIARALLKNPEIFIMDEPTSFLDNNNETKIKDILENISLKCLVIVVAHRISTIVNANKIYEFQNGVVRELGDIDRNQLFEQTQWNKMLEKTN